MISVNNKLMLTPYTGVNKIEASVKSGFATIKQKSSLIGLTLVADGMVSTGKEMKLVAKGQVVYFSEEVLHASDWAKKTFKIDGSEDSFILAEASYVVAVK